MHIATRHYDDRHPITHEWFDLEDRLFRKPNGQYALLMAGDLPGDPPIERSLTLAEVFAWYQECPSQIKRAVINGGRHIEQHTHREEVRADERQQRLHCDEAFEGLIP